MHHLLPMAPTICTDLVATTEDLWRTMAPWFSECLKADWTFGLVVLRKELDFLPKILEHTCHTAIVLLCCTEHVIDKPDAPSIIRHGHRLCAVHFLELSLPFALHGLGDCWCALLIQLK